MIVLIMIEKCLFLKNSNLQKHPYSHPESEAVRSKTFVLIFGFTGIIFG